MMKVFRHVVVTCYSSSHIILQRVQKPEPFKKQVTFEIPFEAIAIKRIT